MENLTIISTNVIVQARQEINGNTVDFSWNNEQGINPTTVNFFVKRGIIGDPTFTGNNAISGSYYSDTQKYDFINNRTENGDSDLYIAILEICKSITNPEDNENEA